MNYTYKYQVGLANPIPETFTVDITSGEEGRSLHLDIFLGKVEANSSLIKYRCFSDKPIRNVEAGLLDMGLYSVIEWHLRQATGDYYVRKHMSFDALPFEAADKDSDLVYYGSIEFKKII